MKAAAGTNPRTRQSLPGHAGIRLAAGLCALCLWAANAPAEPQPASPAESLVRVTPEIKSMIRGGLKFLASKQNLDGSWSLKEGRMGHPVAITGYALLSFMAAGNLPHEGEYAKNVASGMQFLLDSAQPDGLFRGTSSSQYMYNHGIATIALAELYGEAQAPTLRPKLERAVGVILKAQNKEGGWRYTPAPRDADISVTVLQVVALRAAQDAGIAIPQDTIEKAIAYVGTCYHADKEHPERGGFSYQPAGAPGFARTAAAIYSLQVLGKYDDPKVSAGSKYLFANVKDRAHWSYGNYYAAPAQYMLGGDTWQNWYTQISRDIIKTAQREGEMVYWDKAADGSSPGAVFSTAVFVHVLAMPYHLMPLYQR